MYAPVPQHILKFLLWFSLIYLDTAVKMIVVLEVYENSVLGGGSRKCAGNLNLIYLNSRCKKTHPEMKNSFSECALDLGIAAEVFVNCF